LRIATKNSRRKNSFSCVPRPLSDSPLRQDILCAFARILITTLAIRINECGFNQMEITAVMMKKLEKIAQTLEDNLSYQ